MAHNLRPVLARRGLVRALSVASSTPSSASLSSVNLLPRRLVSSTTFRLQQAAASSTSSPSSSSTSSEANKGGKHVFVEVKDGVAVVKFDAPGAKVNSLNEAVMDEMGPIFNQIESDSSIKSVVLISGKPSGFIAGADIKMLEKVKTAQDGENISKFGQDMMSRMEKSPKPIVAAIMGPCLGGGLEVALGCHYRIAINGMKTSLGLPEVMLGLLPGGGGTQRVSKLAGIPNALDMCLTGRMLNAKKAKKMGLVDLLVEPLGPGLAPADISTHKMLEEVAIMVAQQLADGRMKLPDRGPKNFQEKAMAWAMGFDQMKNYVFNTAKEKVMKQTNGLYPAPLKILDVIRAGADKGPSGGYKAEAQGFGELCVTPESKALISLFHGQTECKKNKFGDPAKKVQ